MMRVLHTLRRWFTRPAPRVRIRAPYVLGAEAGIWRELP
jgi:hypothetical protein